MLDIKQQRAIPKWLEMYDYPSLLIREEESWKSQWVPGVGRQSYKSREAKEATVLEVKC